MRSHSARFRFWTIASIVKWIVLAFSVSFTRGFPPAIPVSIGWMAFLFGHFSSEYFFPGSWRALRDISRRPPFRAIDSILLLFAVAALVLMFFLPYAQKHQWLPLAQIRSLVFASLGLLGLWLIAFAVFRDILIVLHWPSEKGNG